MLAERSQNRLLQLDVLRGLAALSVLLFHYTARFDQLYGHAPGMVLIYVGQRGVDLFFVISGFVIIMTIEKTRRGMDFVVSRFSRLFPAYWVAIALTFLIVNGAGLPGREVTARVAIANFSMLPGFFQIPYVDSVYWTLTLELSFYAIIFALYELRMLSRLELVCSCWLMMLLVVKIAGERSGLKLPLLLDLLVLQGYAQLFVAGMIIYQIHQRGSSFGRATILISCILTQWYVQGWMAGIVAVISIAGVCAAIRNWLRWLEIRPLLFLGTISYSLYLIHQNIGYVILRACYARGLNNYLGIVIAAAVAISLATAMTLVIERPAMRAIRAWYRRFFRTSDIVPSPAARELRA